MRWGMHKWFLVGMFLAAVICGLLIVMVETMGAAVTVGVAYLLVSSFLLWIYFRRREDQRIIWCSRELRCKWPTDPTLRLRRAAPVSRRAVLVALD
jgi:hypothetical protein